mgnify:CR=1 FL=1
MLILLNKRWLIGKILVFLCLKIDLVKNSSYKLIKDGVIAILHNKIYTLGKQYIAQEHISVEALDDFEHLYNAYHALGGNGTGTEIYKRVKELPMKQGKE